MRELESVALQFPPMSFDGVGNKLLNVARALNWDDGTAVFLKVELARLINPEMHEKFYDQNALTDESDDEF